MLHTERTWNDRDSNPEPSCCEATVLTTELPCCPYIYIYIYIFKLRLTVLVSRWSQRFYWNQCVTTETPNGRDPPARQSHNYRISLSRESPQHTHTHIHTHTCTHTHIHTRTCTHTHTCTLTQTCTHTHAHTHKHPFQMRNCMS